MIYLNPLLSVFFIFSQIFLAFAADVAGSKRIDSQTTSSLPHCVNKTDEVEKIISHIKANSKNNFKYDKYKEFLNSDSEVELLARLTYSETLAANCKSENDKIVPLITEAIANRIRIRKRSNQDIRSVVFQRDQYASSLNIYNESQYKEFLCPSDAALWNKAYSAAKNALSSPTPTQLNSESVNYFLYKHSSRWTQPPWRFEPDTKVNDPKILDCIKFFKVPDWK